MSQQGIHFANDWISDAIDHLSEASEHRPAALINAWMTQLIADAALEGITRSEIEEGVGDLADYMTACLAEAGKLENRRR